MKYYNRMLCSFYSYYTRSTKKFKTVTSVFEYVIRSVHINYTLLYTTYIAACALLLLFMHSVVLCADGFILMEFMTDGFSLVYKQKAMLDMQYARPTDWVECVTYYDIQIVELRKRCDSVNVLHAMSELPSGHTLHGKLELLRNSCDMLHYKAQAALYSIN
jgi:hypothetical protein